MVIEKYKVLFICLGNICRSPSAEAVFTAKVKELELDNYIEIDSAGIIGHHEGEKADARMRVHAEKRECYLTSISRQIKNKDFNYFDIIIGMDDSNIDALSELAKNIGDNVESKIYKMTDFSSNIDYTHVPDPYYGGEQGFELVLDILDEACNGLLKFVRTKIGQ